MLSWQSTLDLVDLLRTRALQWRGSTVEGRRARTVQRPEGVRTDPYDYHYAWAVCGVPASARVSYERAGLTPAATSCTSSYLVGPSGASSVCGVTPSPKNGGRRDYMFGIWRAATMLGTTVATRRTCGEGPVGMSLCPAGRWRMRGVRDRDLGPAYAGARLLPEEQETLCQREQTLCQREQRPTHARRCAGLACGARSSPWGGGCARPAGGCAAVCGAPAGRVPVAGLASGRVFIIAVHHAFVLGLGARHGGIVKLSEGG